jgi:hypothetical protein
MGNPLPGLGTYEAAAHCFKSIAGELRPPLHLVAGNHCVGDKPQGWVPVSRVCEDYLAQYAACYGRDFYGFDHGPCRFVVLNSLLVNSGLQREREQRAWLEDELARAAGAGRRIWMMMHYPAYVAHPEEPGSYDNVDEPGRFWLLDLMERHGVEAAFSGHVHNYFYNRYAATHLYTLPATSFVRQDYGEMYHVAPRDDEGGRDDRDKLGYFLVKVFEGGHVHHLVRTGGRRRDASEADGPAPPATPLHPLEARLAPLGVEMWENWLRRVGLHTNNSVSPFTRRQARNDWPLPALTEMGVRRVRVFLAELDKVDVRRRMATLEAAGYEFEVYSHGIPQEREYAMVRRHRSMLVGWELILSSAEIDAVAAGSIRLALGLPGNDLLPCYLNEVRDIEHVPVDGANVKHDANFGFQPTDRERLEALCRSRFVAREFKGFVFRIRRRGEPELSPGEAIRQVSAFGRRHGVRNRVHILFSGNLTSDRLVDDLGTANRVAESAFAAWAFNDVQVYFDTFEDVDRGYFVHHGLVDRRYNPRLAARVLKHLNAALAGLRPAAAEVAEAAAAAVELTSTDGPDHRCLRLTFAEGCLVLVLPRPRRTLEEVEVGGACRQLTLLDLGSGVGRDVAFKTAGARLRLAAAVTVETPHLLVAGPVVPRSLRERP